jgi:hypothetical protein
MRSRLARSKMPGFETQRHLNDLPSISLFFSLLLLHSGMRPPATKYSPPRPGYLLLHLIKGKKLVAPCECRRVAYSYVSEAYGSITFHTPPSVACRSLREDLSPCGSMIRIVRPRSGPTRVWRCITDAMRTIWREISAIALDQGIKCAHAFTRCQH